MSAPCHVFLSAILLIIISSAEGGILKDLLQGRRQTEGIGSTAQLPTPAPVRQPLNRNEQNYLYDSTEVNRKTTAAKTAEKKMTNTIVPMKDIGNGVFEFEVGVRKCKFYTDNRQAQRSLMCNAKQCSANQKKWLCDGLSCSVMESSKKATCEDMKDNREIITAPSRRPSCPAGQGVDGLGKCRSPF